MDEEDAGPEPEEVLPPVEYEEVEPYGLQALSGTVACVGWAEGLGAGDESAPLEIVTQMQSGCAFVSPASLYQT